MTERGNLHSIQDQPLEGVSSIEVDAERVSFVFESDAAMANVIELHAEPADNAPSMTRSGNRVRISQSGQYMADSTPVVRLPTGKIPGLGIDIDRGSLTISFDDVETDLGVNVDRGNVRISGGQGSTGINVDRGNVLIANRTGDLGCNIDRGDLVVKGVTGNAGLNLDNGNATITETSGKLSLNVDRGQVTIVRPREQTLRVSAGNGNVTIRHGSVRGMTVKIERGNILSRTQLLPGPRDGDEDDADIDDMVDEPIVDVEGIVDEALGDAGITGEAVRFNLGGMLFEAGEEGVRIARGDQEVFRASPEGVEIRGRDGKPTFAASDRGVAYRGRDIGEIGQRYHFTTARGNVQVDIPTDLAARVELIVNRGLAESDIPLVEVNRPGPRGSTRRFVGVTDSSAENRVLIRASTGRGNVEVRRRPISAPTPPSPPSQPEPPAPPFATGTGSRDERRRSVLDALSKGRISIEEAQALISAIERE